MTSVDVKFSMSATATAGKMDTEDGRLDLLLAAPKELGGSGDGTNPEQLFAADYSACILSSSRVAGLQRKVHLPADASVTADMGLGPRSEGEWGLVTNLSVNLPGIASKEAGQLIYAAHQICPYSNSTRNNVEVNLHVALGHYPS